MHVFKCKEHSTVNKKKVLNIMVENIDPHIIGITESWANKDGAENVLDIVLSSQNELVDIVKIHEPLGITVIIKNTF